MPKKDPRVDAYIAKAAPFAQPILKHIRKIVHQACPEVQETLKWGMPSFEYKGILCGIAAFKQHCVFGFWLHDLMFPKGSAAEEAMGQFGRLTSVKELPANKILLGHVRKAVELNEAGAKRPVGPKKPKQPLVVPAYFLAAMKKNKKAQAAFEAFSYSHKKEYVEWITEAKREETRAKRIETALEWLSKGKSRNWRYERC